MTDKSNKIPIAGAIAGALGITGTLGALYCIKSIRKVLSQKSTDGRYRAYYNLTFDWLMKKNENPNFSDALRHYFDNNEIKTVAIYGSGTLGELFYNEIKGTELKVAYFIDKNAEDIYAGIDNIPIVGFGDIKNQEMPDAIIVTPIFDFEEIKEDLKESGCNLNAVSLAYVIHSL